jgi:hypothetical protein
MRITILAHAHPGSADTFDPVVGQVAAALRRGGQRVSILAVPDQPGKLISSLKRRQPDLAFNLTQRSSAHCLSGRATVGLLDMLGLPCTGSGPGEHYIQHDPSLVCKLLTFDRIPFPSAGDEVSRSGRPPPQGSIYHVGVLGNEKATSFPPVQMHLEVADCRLSASDFRSKSEYGSSSASAGVVVADITADEQAQFQRLALGACTALRVRDYGLVAMRLSRTGEPVLTGVDAHCSLVQAGEYATAAAAAGLDYVGLVNRIADLALARAGEQSPPRQS